MNNTIDIVKAAQERKYTRFEEMAKEMLMSKIAENPIMKSNWKELKSVSEAFEKDSDENDNDNNKDDDEDEDDEDEDED